MSHSNLPPPPPSLTGTSSHPPCLGGDGGCLGRELATTAVRYHYRVGQAIASQGNISKSKPFSFLENINWGIRYANEETRLGYPPPHQHEHKTWENNKHDETERLCYNTGVGVGMGSNTVWLGCRKRCGRKCLDIHVPLIDRQMFAPKTNSQPGSRAWSTFMCCGTQIQIIQGQNPHGLVHVYIYSDAPRPEFPDSWLWFLSEQWPSWWLHVRTRSFHVATFRNSRSIMFFFSYYNSCYFNVDSWH